MLQIRHAATMFAGLSEPPSLRVSKCSAMYCRNRAAFAESPCFRANDSLSAAYINTPQFRKPPGLGLLNKVRGEPLWTGWFNVAVRLVSDMLVLLGTKRDLYLAMEERKIGRTRWVDVISLQTNDPAED